MKTRKEIQEMLHFYRTRKRQCPFTFTQESWDKMHEEKRDILEWIFELNIKSEEQIKERYLWLRKERNRKGEQFGKEDNQQMMLGWVLEVK